MRARPSRSWSSTEKGGSSASMARWRRFFGGRGTESGLFGIGDFLSCANAVASPWGCGAGPIAPTAHTQHHRNTLLPPANPFTRWTPQSMALKPDNPGSSSALIQSLGQTPKARERVVLCIEDITAFRRLQASCTKFRRWKPLDNWLAASPTTSTMSWPPR